MRILLDMNLAPGWCKILQQHGWDAIHWSSLGSGSEPDSVLMEWAAANGYVVLTHDLDPGALLVSTRAKGPSVVQTVRAV